jgi:hypothetical protein
MLCGRLGVDELRGEGEAAEFEGVGLARGLLRGSLKDSADGVLCLLLPLPGLEGVVGGRLFRLYGIAPRCRGARRDYCALSRSNI